MSKTCDAKPRSRGWIARCALAATVLGALTSAVAAQRPAVPAATITLPAGATLAQAVAELARASDGVVVADVALKDRRLVEALDNIPLDEALARISVDFDRYYVRRGRSLALQLRRSDPGETPGVDLEEGQQAAGDTARLLRAVPLMRRLGEFDAAIVAFVTSLTPRQEAAMLERGLAFAQLTPPQQQLLMSLSAHNAYNQPVSLLTDASRAVSGFPTATLEMPAARGATGRPRNELIVRYVDQQTPRGRGLIQLFVRLDDLPPRQNAIPFVLRRPATLPAGEERPETARTSSRAWPSDARELSLREFAAEWQRGTRERFRLPEYAADRKFWIASVSGTRLEAAQTIADLWAWQVSSQGQTRVLGRPVFAAASDAAALHEAIRQTIPPAIWRAAENRDVLSDTRRTDADLRRLLQRVADSGKGEIAVSELDTQQQAQLASAILIHAIPYLWTHGHGREAAQPYLTAPEGVVLNYRGPMDGDPKSSIVVLAPAQTRGQVGWGFPALRGVPRRGGAIDQ